MVGTGVGAMLVILYMGKKREKWTGTSGPRFVFIQVHISVIIAGSSFCPGMIRFVISSQTPRSLSVFKRLEHGF